MKVATVLFALLAVAVAMPEPEPDSDQELELERRNVHVKVNDHGDGPVKCRKTPYLVNNLITHLNNGDTVSLKCAERGQSVFGTNLWYKVDRTWPRRDCFTSDYYLKTGTTKKLPSVPWC